MTSFLQTQSLPTRAIRLILTCACLFLLFQFVSLFLSWPKQIVLGGISIVIVLVLNRSSKSHVVTIALMLCSITATLRYGWWRVHMIVDFFSDEANHRVTIDAVLMMILLSAEAYTILIMVFGFIQTSSPLRRKPIPLPADESRWPHVDVLIPTYNEPLSLVRYTALAAINIDYPPEKLHVYILDDGTREEFRSFCEEANVGYVVRAKHNHAKAGNINHALTKMNSPLVTIFDCDHVPTRSFLQVTVGWFLADQKLAMLQTPHHFYSPDPFERNLLQYKTIPNEGELFYGIIQDGSDLWNATFFCGSCAVIRRTALNEVGGIATETVTEDAHTSLRMQKKGWGTAYINLPQAAGLATETLSAHVGQRIRWARGMIQIFRTDNPMLASGMKFTQRLCYFNAMLHFLYAVPRLIFLVAPLVYMIAGRTIIPGYWVAILAYALPHLFISSLTNSRMQGKHRHSFWNEIYETVLAPYILMPTLLALINPKLGSFNVTDKGGTLAETKFDRSIAAPTTWLLGINLLGVCVVPYRLIVTDPTHPGTVLSNLFWILFNMVILGVAAAVANEQQQRRTSVRIHAKINIRLKTESGVFSHGITSDVSVGGASLRLSQESTMPPGTHLQVSFPDQTGDAEIGATFVGQYNGNYRLRFDSLSIAEQETLTCALYSRANSWVGTRGHVEVDRPLVSLGRVIRLSFTGFNQVIRGLLPESKPKNTSKPQEVAKKAAVAVGLLLALLLPRPAHAAQIAGFATPQPVLIPLTEPAAAPAPTLIGDNEATDRITLKDMGVQGGNLDMHGPRSTSSLGFVLSNNHIPRRGQINLTYHFSAAILPHTGSIRVLLNGTLLGQIFAPAVHQQEGEYGFVSFPIPPELLIRNNDLSFEFAGGATLQLESRTESTVLAGIGSTSTILVVGDRIPLKNDLSLLPLPFFDSDLQTTTTLPFVFLTQPTPGMLQAAGIVASWFGVLQSAKPIHFSVSVGAIPPGNVVVFADRTADLPAALQIPAGSASLSLKANPSDPTGSALVLAGDDDSQLLMAARNLVLIPITHTQPGSPLPLIGDSIRVDDFALPPERKPDDAPRWLMTDRLRNLATDNPQLTTRVNGSRSIPVYLRLPPDLFYGETQNLNLSLTYRYNALAVATGSALRVYLNGKLVNEAALPPGTDFADRTRHILVPTETMRPFGNTMLLNFDFVAANPRDPGTDPARALQGDVQRNSSLDITGLAHWAAMPNLELFANAGFPFTRMADLADTTIVLPVAPSPKEIALLLYLMAHFGTQTGYPSLRVEIAGPDAVLRSGRDYLILGNIDDQPAFASLDPSLPATLDANGIHLKQFVDRLGWISALWHQVLGDTPQETLPSNNHGIPEAMIEGIESPSFAGRSIVLVALSNDQAVDRFADVFLDRSQSSDISQSVSLLRGTRFTSYAVPTAQYHVGYISNYRLMRIWMAQNFVILLLVVTAFGLLIATWTRDFLLFQAASRLEPANHPL